ncbi:MAG: galactokinase, partial [Vicinamibacterales bacterium]
TSLARLDALDPLLARRARHVITENQRVLEAAAALRAADAAALGRLMNASHASMRDDYEISTPDIDTLVALMQEEPGVFGARMTGGGFGGSIVGISRAVDALAAAEHVAQRYCAATRRDARILLPLKIPYPGHAA